MPGYWAELIIAATKDQGRNSAAAQGFGLIGAIHQGAGLAQERVWSYAQRHLHAKIQNVLTTGPGREIFGFHLVPHHRRKPPFTHGHHLGDATRFDLFRFSHRICVHQRNSLDPLWRDPQHLHRDDPAHRQACNGKTLGCLAQ